MTIWILLTVFVSGIGLGALSVTCRHLVGDFLDWLFLPPDDEDHWLEDHPNG